MQALHDLLTTFIINILSSQLKQINYESDLLLLQNETSVDHQFTYHLKNLMELNEDVESVSAFVIKQKLNKNYHQNKVS